MHAEKWAGGSGGVRGPFGPDKSKNLFSLNDLIQGQLQRWTEHSTLIFENLKPVEISENLFNII